ncbi:MAG: type 2 isopentenyl-diphosphate Delta-isomerase [Chloroflexi bacterium]|nr:type 2 isopentenyl-diphosphate Delta-isomerase [Chloroflexota bacterium]
MDNSSETSRRKFEHIRINLEEDVRSGITTGLENYRFKHCALPEIDLEEVDPSVEFLGKTVALPFLVSSMTGGTEDAYRINQNLAMSAEKFNLAMGVGSQRVGLEDQSTMQTFKVRDFAPNILLLANLGAIQLNTGYSIEHCQQAVDAIGANALVLHLNPLQEALMEEGDTNFRGLLMKIESVCRELDVPVIVKEVGWGISTEIASQLIDAGVKAIDVAGAGGTSWSEVEKHRMKSDLNKEVASAFKDWGIPTAVCINEIHQSIPEFPLIASGGLKNGIDIAKYVALGANLGGMARQFLLAAAESAETLENRVKAYQRQFITAMFVVGARNISELQDNKIIRVRE